MRCNCPNCEDTSEGMEYIRYCESCECVLSDDEDSFCEDCMVDFDI